ncbi:MAG: hypothetical protein F4027_00605 [Rhodospirillaceae bacterium]|nr:hypothetical protein [Rhodospirillaceae bacterium]MDE0619639.1 hypothetical protein [Rhodospirillaceae bacterium]MYF87531.1 hypothetical protein [Rhodospirillaceae bacterium]MYH35851.1 hypothetical protein [Rhodospirillaceae bacterium]MYK57162.1 hypothetical protein [Rhodospirillaceae bacterium]
MPNRTTAALAACAAFLFAASVQPAAVRAQDGSIVAGAHGSTLGAGISLGYDISPAFSARAVANYFSFDRKESSAGNQYSVDVQLLSFGLLGDWHPFENGFRVTAGVLYNGNKFTFASRTSEFGAGDTDDYDGNLKAELGFNAVAPYLGIGWTSGRADGSGFSFFADAGAIYQGAPRLSVSGRAEVGGSSCSFSVSESGRATVRGDCSDQATLSADLEKEHADLKGQLDNFKFYPVVMLGVTYRF